MWNPFMDFLLGDCKLWLKNVKRSGHPLKIKSITSLFQQMQGTAQQYAKYANELQCPPAFIALMLRDIADTFEENAVIGDKGCDCC